MKKSSVLYGVICFILGIILSGIGVAYAAGVTAEPSNNTIYVDGRQVKLEAYLINGTNYVKLRDVGQVTNAMNVYWDGAVQIESGVPYTGEAPAGAVVQPEPSVEAPSETDYSAAANPEIFSGSYTREAYNAAFKVLSTAKAGDLAHIETVHFSDGRDREQFELLLEHIANGVTISLRGIGNEAYEVYAHKVDRSAADAAIDGFIREVSVLSSDREKLIRLNEWICEHMEYDSKAFASVDDIAASATPVTGNCTSYARMLNHLCGRLGIPCIKVYGESHCWNMVWADGSWGYIDVSLNDLVYGHTALLFGSDPPKKINDPSGLRFLQELLVPGSTT